MAIALNWLWVVALRRTVDDLHELRRCAEQHARLTEVADLRHRIGTVVAAV